MTAAVQKNLELPYEEYERFDLSVQRVYKLIWVLCTQRVHPFKTVLDMWTVMLSQLDKQMKIKELSIMDTKGSMPWNFSLRRYLMADITV